MKALLVDDSKAARFAMRNLLQKQDLEVEVAASGEEALEMLKEMSDGGLVDLIFMDQSMPGMGGIEATRQIKDAEKTAHIPIVLCTGNEGDKLEAMAAEAGAIGVLTKPPKADEIKAIIDGLGAAKEVVEAPTEEQQAESELVPVAEVAVTESSQLMDDLEQRITKLETLEATLTRLVTDKISVLEKASDAKLKPLQANVGSIKHLVAKQIKEQMTVDSSNQRIQLEGLRQQVESGLDDMQEREASFRSSLSEELSSRSQELTDEKLAAHLAQTTDTSLAIKEDVRNRLNDVEDTAKSIKSGLLTSAILISILFSGIAFAAAYYFLR